jgi:hypothetical protein
MQRNTQVQNVSQVGSDRRNLQRLIELMRSASNNFTAASSSCSDGASLFASVPDMDAIAAKLVACVAQRVASALANKCRRDVAIQLSGLSGGGYGAKGIQMAQRIVKSHVPAVATPSISLNDLIGGLKVDFDYQALSEQVSVMKNEAEADFSAIFDEVLAAVAAKKQSLDETNNENDNLSIEQAVSEALRTLVP